MGFFQATTPPILGPDRRPAPGSVATIERIALGGFEQSVVIRGRNRENPILLFVHGGPGMAEQPLIRWFNASLEDHFVVVAWDQRGAGRSWSRTLPREELRFEKIVSDARELIAVLKRRFGQEKVVLLGHSWGTIVGLTLAHRHPEDVAAYVGAAQIINGADGERLGYEHALAVARQRGLTKAVRELESIGPPPYQDSAWLQHVVAVKRWSQRLGAYFHGPRGMGMLMPAMLRCSEASLLDKITSMRGIEPSMQAMWPETMGAAGAPGVDFLSSARQLQVPVFFCAGRHDHVVPSSLVERYLAELQAPHKELCWFESSAHMQMYEEPGRFHEVMVDVVLPIVRERLAAEYARSARA